MGRLNVLRPVVRDVLGVPHYGHEELVEDEAAVGPAVVSLLGGQPQGSPVVGHTDWGHMMLCFRRDNVAVLVTEFPPNWARDRVEEFLRTRSGRG